MVMSEILLVLVPVLLAILALAGRITQEGVKQNNEDGPSFNGTQARTYQCQEMVPDMELAVTYRDAPLKQCPKHGTPMKRV